MITIAIPGGTSLGLGRSIVTAIQEHPHELRPVVLSRESSTIPEWLSESGIEVRKVDYTSEQSLYTALQGIHTVICVLLAVDGTWASTQKNLLRAGLRAGIKRFAPAEFGVSPRAAHTIDMLKPSLEVMIELQKIKADCPEFEYACFQGGLFMNYLGYGAPDEKAATHEMCDTWRFVWDVENMKAALPLTADGEVPRITMTEIGDVGKFVAAACLLPTGKWKADFSMVGDTLKVDEVVSAIERVRGGKMEVSYRSYEQIEREEEQEEVPYPNKFWLQYELALGRKTTGEGVLLPTVNGLCPSVKALSVDEYLEKFWA